MRLDSLTLGSSSEVHRCVFKNERDKVAKCLRKTPERVNSRDTDGKTPLIVAASFNRHDIIDVLLTSSLCDVDARDNEGNTALHEAADRGYTEVIRKIVESGKCNPNVQNVRGETALMKAAIYDYVEIARILLKLGAANPDVQDTAGQTALLIALREGSHMTVDALIHAGCDVNITNNIGESALYVATNSPLAKSLEPAKRLIEAGYDLSADRIWLLNEEKHTLFYQDDEFYTELRCKLRKCNLGKIDIATEGETKTSVDITGDKTPTKVAEEASPKSSPRRSPVSPPFTMSPMLKQKIMSTETFSNGLAMEWSTPPSSPMHSRRLSKRSSSSSSPRPTLTPKSSFESDVFESPCSSPVPMTYPAAHINLHMFTRQCSETSGDKPETSYSHFVNSSDHFNKSELDEMLKAQNIGVAEGVDKTVKRQQSEKISSTRKDNPTNSESRKISLPSKPTVQFSSKIQVYNLSKRN